MRTLEQKISDAGPNYQRAEPLILTEALKMLEREGIVKEHIVQNIPWYYLSAVSDRKVEERLETLHPIYEATQQGSFKTRLGKTLEISVFKALARLDKQFLGHYGNTDSAEPNWIKVDPPATISARTLGQGKLDFVLFDFGGPAGIEVKNYRQWLYPDTVQIKELFRKCSALNLVPVLIARRFPYLTFQFLKHAGAVVHQTYNQLYFKEDEELGDQARRKDLLGYHDIRFGTAPDVRLLQFLHSDLPNVLPDARRRFDTLLKIHTDYGSGALGYSEWKRMLLVNAGVWSGREDEG